MTYWRKEWNLYVCRFVFSSKTVGHTDQGDLLVEESYYTQLELFKSNHPEHAYEHAVSLIPQLNYGYRNDQGQEVQDVCLGIHDLDLLQENSSSLDNILSRDSSITLDVFSGTEMRKEAVHLVRHKEDFSLFKDTSTKSSKKE